MQEEFLPTRSAMQLLGMASFSLILCKRKKNTLITKKDACSIAATWFSHLLHISVCSLPHVVILYDTGQRLPRQLHKKKQSSTGRERETDTEQINDINISCSCHLGAKPSCIFMSKRHRDHRGSELLALLGSGPQTETQRNSHI